MMRSGFPRCARRSNEIQIAWTLEEVMKQIWSFKNKEESLQRAALSLSKDAGISLMTATLCVNRGLKTADEVRVFLNPKLEQLTHPYRILDLEKAARRIFESQNKADPEKIRVYTDYDVDGTTGAALLTWFFRDLKFNFSVRQPDRFKDGYGLNVGAVEEAHADGVKILITVDCGITNFDAAKKAAELGIELIIVDHHSIDPVHGIPAAYAVIDPQRSDDESGLKMLCGCALGFYLCLGIRSLAREAGYFAARAAEGVVEPNMKSLLDLVVIATAADMVPLIGDNRILVKHGLDVLKDTQKPGLKALCDQAGFSNKTMNASSLGFSIGPRINASGRMGSAETAYKILISRDPIESNQLAQELEAINKQRADLQNLIWDEVRSMVNEGIERGEFSSAVVVASENWHEGVVGIVAAKVTEHFKRPAIVMAIREDGIAKGSVRSYAGYNVLEALHLTKDFLKGYGGHKYAAGLSLSPESVNEFSKAYNLAVSTLTPTRKDEVYELEGEFELADFTPKAIEEIEKFAPYGTGNPEPLFGVKAHVEYQNVLKGRHMKLKLGPGKVLEGIWFNAAERLEVTEMLEKSAQFRKPCLFAGIPELNRYMGRVTPTLRIKAATDIQ
jgi:single-stranded-DNA-specific exonuclease